MKNYNINPNKVSDLVHLAANLYAIANDDVGYSPQKGEKATQMHFVVDLLKDLVDTAYPTEHGPATKPPANKNKSIGQRYHEYRQHFNQRGLGQFVMSLEKFKELEEDLENIAKMMKGYNPPKAGEF